MFKQFNKYKNIFGISRSIGYLQKKCDFKNVRYIKYSAVQKHIKIKANFDISVRCLTLQNTKNPDITISKPSSEYQDLEILNHIYNDFLKGIVTSNEAALKESSERLNKIMDYNVTDGKKMRALILMNAYRILKSHNIFSTEDMKQPALLGWCMELLQGFFLIMDDIMDRSLTRRSKLCWYKKEGIIAINDALFLEQLVYKILSSHFKKITCYQNLVELFHIVTLKTIHGQCLDMLSTPAGTKPILETFTAQRYDTIVKYKTAYYSFVLPVRLALYLAGIENDKAHEEAEAILLKIGHYYQVQDDYLDCFGDYETTGKHGTDIEDAKCSWLLVQALQKASHEQMEVIKKNYGMPDPNAIDKIKQVYIDLKLKDLFLKYEEETYAEISKMILKNTTLPSEIFTFYVQKIYKRKK